MSNNSVGLVIYMGEAQPGASEAAAVWRIKKLAYTDNMPISVKWASGTADFDKKWTLYDTYVYS